MIPHAMERLDRWCAARRRAGRLLLALDFDGTLAPIVEAPEVARLQPAVGRALRRLLERPDTDVAVVSGRALEDVRAKVGLTDLYYAGNHGLEIEGPGLERRHREASEARPVLAACLDQVRRELDAVEGVLIEDKGLTASVHYRGVVQPVEQERVRDRVRELCGDAGLRVTEGKKVMEIRPAVSWDKGRATRFLLEALEAGSETRGPALFIGDDVTDEDAFRALKGRGDGILVASSPPASTAAAAYLRSVDEVAELLEALAESP